MDTAFTDMLRLPTIPQYYQIKELPSASNIRDGLRNIRLSTRRRPASLPHFAPMSWGRMYLDCRVSRGFLWFLSRTGQILGTTIWFFSFQWVSRVTRKDIERGQDASDKEAGASLPKIDEYVSMDSKGETISGGVSGLVQRLPSGDVIKIPWPGLRAEKCRGDLTAEYNIYKILGPHPRLVKIINWSSDDCSLTMEYMPNGCLKDYILANNDKISACQRLQWIMEAAEGLQLLHSKNIIHCDVEPKNFLLDAGLGLKIADFSGSSLDGSRASACVGTRFERPGLDLRCAPTVKDDLFSFGSTIYMIITGHYPFQELDSNDVIELFEAQNFPSVAEIICGEIINQCWRGEISSAQTVCDFIQTEMKELCPKSETSNDTP
ncbi:hypothetical protein VE00_10300 [Pseudogymnoascus sp. WSF 3629]|nr:hypothetical protein VE00_10300 [Pseudogymnoascus sp. WSF 3629]